MSTTAILRDYAETALAAYAVGLRVGPDAQNTEQFIDSGDGMSRAQAEAFNTRWTVIAQSDETSWNLDGFSAALLRNAAGQTVLAIRGTNDALDVVTDIVNVGYLGTVVNMPQYGALEAFHSSLVSSGRLGANEQIVVTGHSLGGFLAQAFTVRNPAAVSAAYTYNAPGFGAIEALLGFLGVTNTAAASKITNVRASDGISFTAGLGLMLGSTVNLRIEASAFPNDNHSIVRLGDALAVQTLYAQLQPDLTPAQVSALFGSAGRGDRRLEDALDALRTAFTGSAGNDANRTPTGDRERLWQNLQSLQAHADFRAMAGRVRFEPVQPGTPTQALGNTHAALAHRFALLELLPFSVVADTEADNQRLYAPYAPRLSLYDEATGQGELTQQWMRDRALLIDAIRARNVMNGGEIAYAASLPLDRTFELRWSDAMGAAQVLLAENTARPWGVLQPRPPQLLHFGGDANDVLTGTSNQMGDHLYGGAGNDTLSGQGGGDYLEGNSGNDNLQGGAGSDMLLGGTGNDTLEGGADNDQLRGGAGLDTYRFATGSGFDTVDDADGSGRIEVTGIGTLTGAGAVRVGDGVWRSADGRVSYSLVGGAGAASPGGLQDLQVQVSSGTGASLVTDTFVIKGWGTTRSLGITLPSAWPVTPPPPAYSWNLDFGVSGAIAQQAVVNLYQMDWVRAGQPALRVVNGSAGPQRLAGGGFADVIAGGTQLHPVERSFAGIELVGGGGNDSVFAVSEQSLAQALAGVPVLVPAAGTTEGPQLDGGAGDDLLVGSSVDDLVFGGSGNDQIITGGGRARTIAETQAGVANMVGIGGNGPPSSISLISGHRRRATRPYKQRTARVANGCRPARTVVTFTTSTMLVGSIASIAIRPLCRSESFTRNRPRANATPMIRQEAA